MEEALSFCINIEEHYNTIKLLKYFSDYAITNIKI